jgi:DNA-binding NtrC family response regulator
MGEDRHERILIVEDDAALREMLIEELEDCGFTMRGVASAVQAEPLLTQWEPAMVVSDLRLPGASGLDLLQRAMALHARPAFLIVTAFGSIAQAVDALKAGADEFLTKPLDMDHFLLAVRRLLETRRLRSEVQRFRKLRNGDHFHGIYGHSRAMRVLFEHIRQVARASGPVLIVGESGSGKELVARAVHAESERADGPFLAVNCAGIPGDLLETEFFGHEAGAFTGAVKAHGGLFRQADHGTLLLDEIGEMPVALQAKLLRVLQDGRIRPVGAQRETTVDVRVLAATHQDMRTLTRAGRFREDLFFRMNTFILQVPPLRERGEDIDVLAARFLNHYSADMGRDIRTLSPVLMDWLRSYAFPGNVRELENIIERAVAFCHGRTLSLEHLPPALHSSAEFKSTGAADDNDADDILERLQQERMLPTLDELTERYVQYVLERTGGNKRRAAALLGISRRTLYRRLGD